jgi:hypothetical protein
MDELGLFNGEKTSAVISWLSKLKNLSARFLRAAFKLTSIQIRRGVAI